MGNEGAREAVACDVRDDDLDDVIRMFENVRPGLVSQCAIVAWLDGTPEATRPVRTRASCLRPHHGPRDLNVAWTDQLSHVIPFILASVASNSTHGYPHRHAFSR